MPNPSPEVQRNRLPFAVYILAMGTFLMGTSEFVIAGILPELAADFDVTIAQAGSIITVFALGVILGAPSFAIVTLSLPRRLTLVIALIVFSLGHLVAAATQDFTIVLAARFVTAIATGAFWSVASLVAAEIAGKNAQSRALGLIFGGGMLANVLGVPLGSFAGQLIGWRGPFWVLAAFAAIASVAVARLVPPDGPHKATPSLRAELVAFRSGKLWLALAAFSLVTGGTLSIYSFISPLLTGRAGLPDSAVPVALVIFGIAALCGSIFGGRLGDAHPYPVALICAITTSLVAAALCLVSTIPVLALMAFGLLGLTGLSAIPILLGLAMQFGGAAPTLAVAMTTSACNVGIAVGTSVSAIAFESELGVLGPPITGTISCMLVLIPLATLVVLHKRAPQRTSPEEDSPYLMAKR